MNIFFRTNSSKKIGLGHVMRCLTLAEELRNDDITIEFITRPHPGNLDDYIISKGFKVRSLSSPSNEIQLQQDLIGYELLLGVNQLIDADETIKVISGDRIDYLIIDHYALDYNWEKKLRPYTVKIMVIDGLANRRHDCDLLLDQNYILDKARYDKLVTSSTLKLLGPKYALLRKDFLINRKKCKNNNEVNRVFVFFGGTDADNLTGISLKALSQSGLRHLFVDVVIGSSNPHRKELKIEIGKNPNAKLYIQVDNIAKLMLRADVALGAGGTTTWERMALGLPSMVVTLAENQINVTRDLDKDGYLKWLGNVDEVDVYTIYNSLLGAVKDPSQLRVQSCRCQSLVKGTGARVVATLLQSD